MALSNVISRWKRDAQPHAAEEANPSFCGPPRPVERRHRLTVRRLHNLMQADVLNAQQREVEVEQPPEPTTALVKTVG